MGAGACGAMAGGPCAVARRTLEMGAGGSGLDEGGCGMAAGGSGLIEGGCGTMDGG